MLDYRAAVWCGGVWYMIQSSTAASTATISPMITCTDIAVVAWKPRTQGDTMTQRPTMRLSHSSQIAKFVSAAWSQEALWPFILEGNGGVLSRLKELREVTTYELRPIGLIGRPTMQIAIVVMDRLVEN